jgi:hypothetical protein
MKQKLEEEYAFYSFAKDDLIEAFSSLKAITKYKRNIAVSALVKVAVISYSRPFKNCRGKYKACYKLQNDIIPDQYKSLHQKIITYRDQIFAHTDIDVRRPDIKKFKIENKTSIAITYRGFSSKDFLHEIEKMKKLIECIVSSLQQHVDEIKNELS